MKINHAIVHRLITDTQFVVGKENARKVDIEFSEEEHPIEEDSQLLVLVKILEDRIKTSGKGSSKFQSPDKESSTTGHFKKYLDERESFLAFSKGVSEILKSKIPETATGGYLTFLDYTIDDSRLIFICVLKLEDGVTIDASTLHVTDATSIQSKHIHEGARIGIDGYVEHLGGAAEIPNYIDWIKTRKGERLSHYIQQLLEIDIEIDNKVQTTIFKKALDHYIDEFTDEHKEFIESNDEIDFTEEELKHELRSKVYELVGHHAKKSSSLDFNDVDELISVSLSHFQPETDYSLEPSRKFTAFVSERYANLNNLFKPFEGQTRNWGVVSHTVKGRNEAHIKFSVDRAMMRDQDYFEFDASAKTVTIKQVGKTFFDQIG